MEEHLAETPRKVLIVDDADTWREYLPELFNNEGVECVVASSAEEAKALLQEGGGGITEIITDGLGGDWRSVVENAGNLPISLLSGSTSEIQTAREMSIRFFDKVDFLSGNVTVKDLLK